MSRTWHDKRLANYRGSKRFDPHCRNHGSCGYCLNNRTHSNSVRREMYTDTLDNLEDLLTTDFECDIIDSLIEDIQNDQV